MADEIKNNNDNILIKTDQQNILYIDPNSILENGVVKQRLVDHEQLVMYVNLEADIIPRSKVYMGGDDPQNKTSVVSLFQGNINFLKPKGRDTFDTSWTDLYTDKLDGKEDIYYSSVSQNFGIRSIQIKQGYMTPPEVTIQFVDVRGKTLFESPENSPYKAFFHLPYPVFYLTVKGYYGKAIRYQLILVSFNARFDSSTGNYEVMCKFVGPTAALLNDIPLQAILAAPYMYPQQIRVGDKIKVAGNATVETSYGEASTTKGYEILKQVYDEYKVRGIIPQDFPYITLKDLAVKAANIDVLLEKQLFEEVIDPVVLSDMDEYEKHLTNFVTNIKSDANRYLDLKKPSADNRGYYSVKQEFNDKWEQVESRFTEIINTYAKRLRENKAFGADKVKSTTKDGKNRQLQPDTIDINFNDHYMLKDGGFFYISPQQILDQINAVRKLYVEQRTKIEKALGEKINQAVKSKDTGIGFEPTIRNLFAVVIAGADVYLRLMDDVHQKAIKNADQRSQKVGDRLEGVYAFPTIITPGGDEKPRVLAYPGDTSVSRSLGAEDFDLWPEVEFVENYYLAAAELEETLSSGATTNVVFPNTDDKNLGYAETITWSPRQKPYELKTPTAVTYELYERAYVASQYSGLEKMDTLRKLGTIEGKNVVAAVKGATQIEHKLKQGRNLTTLKSQLQQLSPHKRWEYAKDDLFTTPYLRNVQVKDYDLSPFKTGDTINTAQYSDYEDVDGEIKGYQPKITQKLYPFVNKQFYTRLEDKGALSKLNDLDFSIHQTLKVDFDYGLVSNEPSEAKWYKGANPENIFKDALFTLSGKTMNIMNTPYFTNALNLDLRDGNFKRSAHLFLSALPFANLYHKLAGSDNYAFATFNQVAATHKLPRLLVLKYGSMWNVYKRYKMLTNDILNGVWTNNDVENLFDGGNGLNLNLNIGGSTTLAAIDNSVGFYPAYYEKLYKSLFGQSFFGFTGTTASEWEVKIQTKINNGLLHLKKPNTANVAIDYYTTFGKVSGSTLVLFPSSAMLVKEQFTSVRRYENMTTRTIWFDPTIEEMNFSSFTFPAPNEHFRTLNGDECGLDKEYRNNWDLLATFKPEILDLFEQEFEKFAQDTLSGDQTTFKSVLYDLLTLKTDFEGVRTEQEDKAKKLSKKLFNEAYNLRICNPKEIDLYIFRNFVEHYRHPRYQAFDPAQVTSGTTAALETIIGEDAGGAYKAFFQDFDLSYDVDHFKWFRMLARYYAGLKLTDNVSPATFVDRVEALIRNSEVKLDEVLSAIFTETNKITLDKVVTDNVRITPDYNMDQTLKLDLYNSFKKFNDQWIGGSIIGENPLMTDFLFIDRANRDVGQKAFINLYAFKNLLDSKNGKSSLYGFIGQLLQDSGFIFYALPSYVNFYGITEIGDFSAPRYTTLEVAADLFGTFLEVDYTKSAPKFLCQYTGLASRYLNLNGISEDFKFQNDSYRPGDPGSDPNMDTPEAHRKQQYDKSNRVVAFEVNFGDQAQGIFKSLSLDQANIKNTAESYAIIEQLATQNNSNNTAQVHTGLFQVYLNRNYTCEVVAMGNVMIQAGMYFYLRNVPMFEGTYLITGVEHKIDGNNIETAFTGVRQSKDNLPDLKDVLIATNKVIYQRLLSSAKARNK